MDIKAINFELHDTLIDIQAGEGEIITCVALSQSLS
jgi:hypothetical protein